MNSRSFICIAAAAASMSMSAPSFAQASDVDQAATNTSNLGYPRTRRSERAYQRSVEDGNPQFYYGARGPEWRRGGYIPREYRRSQYVVNDWRSHRLAPPPPGHQWVQVGADYVLVAMATGLIVQLLLNQ